MGFKRTIQAVDAHAGVITCGGTHTFSNNCQRIS
jgi:hypothetical protein